MKHAGRVAWICGGGLVAIIVAAVLAAYLLGMSFYVITGASMTGAIPKGAVAIERRVPTSSLQVGDVITFRPPNGGGSVTHRIVAIEFDKQGHRVYQTKGDANQAIDPWLFTLDRPVQAKFLTEIPWLGYILAIFTLRLVRVVMLVGVAAVIVVVTVQWLRETSQETDDQSFADGSGVGR
jgi:signal peptidase